MDLKVIQEKINKDKDLRRKFIKDPVQTLESEGLTLTDEMKKQLAGVVRQLTTPVPNVPGSTINSAMTANEWKIGINISIPI